MNPESVKLDEFHYHEALDRTHVQLCALEMALGEHPVIQQHDAANRLYHQATEALAELYQLLGRIDGNN